MFGQQIELPADQRESGDQHDGPCHDQRNGGPGVRPDRFRLCGLRGHASDRPRVGADEVRELLGVLRAIDETADERDVIRALRASCFAISDAELVSWHAAGGRWVVSADPGGPAGQPVGVALARLASFSARRHTQRVDTTLMMLVDELGIRQSLAGRRGRAESLRRIDFVVERARAFAASTGGTIGQFLDFAEQEAAGRAGRAS